MKFLAVCITLTYRGTRNVTLDIKAIAHKEYGSASIKKIASSKFFFKVQHFILSSPDMYMCIVVSNTTMCERSKFQTNEVFRCETSALVVSA